MVDLSLTHWGRVTHICVSKLTIIGSDNGLSPERRQAIIWNNAGILLIGTLGTNFSEILIEILTFSLKKMRLKVSSVKRQPFCLSLNVLNDFCGIHLRAVSQQVFVNLLPDICSEITLIRLLLHPPRANELTLKCCRVLWDRIGHFEKWFVSR